LYGDSFANADDRVRLGRVTDWQGETGQPVRGLGQRTFLVGEDAMPILELQKVEITGRLGRQPTTS
jgi:type VI secretion system protein ImpE